MKKIIILFSVLLFPNLVLADICGTTMVETKVYTSCKPGYYLNTSGTCSLCAMGSFKSQTGTMGCTSCPGFDKGTALNVSTGKFGATSVSDCYVNGGATWDFSDSTGSGKETFGVNCSYSGGMDMVTLSYDYTSASKVGGTRCYSVLGESQSLTVPVGTKAPVYLAPPHSCSSSGCASSQKAVFQGYYVTDSGGYMYDANGKLQSAYSSFVVLSDMTLYAQWKCQ